MRITRDIKKECDEHLNGDDDDDWDGLLGDFESGDEKDEEAEEDRPEEVQKRIVDEVEGIQHLFEEMFKVFSLCLSDRIESKEIPNLDMISDCVMHFICGDELGKEDLRWSQQFGRDVVLERGQRPQGCS